MELPKGSINKLAGCDERLHVLFIEVAKDTPIKFVVTHGYRSIEEQKNLYALGRTKQGKIVTNCDGEKIKSKHNYYPSKAADIALIIDGKLNWEVKNYIEFGEYVKKIAAKIGIKISWGGDWDKFKDYPHYEIVD